MFMYLEYVKHKFATNKNKEWLFAASVIRSTEQSSCNMF